jgi:predicted hydrocarbon binding protein
MRPTLGREVSLWMFRMAYFHGFLQTLDKENGPWGIMAGRKFSRFLDISSYEQMIKAFSSLKLGVVELTTSETSVTVDVSDCAICAGLIGLEEPCCSFIGGLVGSTVEKVVGRDVIVRQTMCQGMGQMLCRFDIEFTRVVAPLNV